MNRYATLEQDYTGGMTIIEIARKRGVSYRAVWQAMVRRGIPRRRKAKRDQRGPKNHMWKGNEASYFSFHKRVRRLRGEPLHCEVCGTDNPDRTYEWANLTGRYEDPADYKRMCKSCHCKFDGLISNITGVSANATS